MSRSQASLRNGRHANRNKREETNEARKGEKDKQSIRDRDRPPAGVK